MSWIEDFLTRTREANLRLLTTAQEAQKALQAEFLAALTEEERNFANANLSSFDDLASAVVGGQPAEADSPAPPDLGPVAKPVETQPVGGVG